MKNYTIENYIEKDTDAHRNLLIVMDQTGKDIITCVEKLIFYKGDLIDTINSLLEEEKYLKASL